MENCIWISVEERLPDAIGNYLATDGNTVFEAHFDFRSTIKWFDPVEEYEVYSVTHWAKMPEPPKHDK